MKDYKHVTVPRRYRITTNRKVVRRLDAESGKNRRRVRGRGAAIFVVLLAAAAVYGAWEGYQWLTSAPIFQITGVDVQGVRKVDDEEIREAAALFAGQNLFKIDPAGVVKKLSANPWVKEVRVERSLPNRIAIRIKERMPRAVLAAANGRFLIDNESTVIMPVKDGEAEWRGFPVVSIRDWKAVAGAPVTAAGISHAFDLIAELETRGGWDMGEVVLRSDTPETITILYAGREFRIGSGNYKEKLRRLIEIVSDMKRRGIAYTAVELRPERQAAVMVAKNVRTPRPNSERKSGRR